MFKSLTISISIDRPHREVYDFLAEPMNLPTWTTGMGPMEPRGENEWATRAAEAELVFSYTPRNAYGVLDFTIRRSDIDRTRVVPARVFANGGGAEVTITHFQLPNMTDAAFQSEAEWIRSDFLTLKTLLEAL